MKSEIIKDCPNVSFNDWGGYSCKLYDPYITDDKKKLVKYGTCEANVDCRFKQIYRLEQENKRQKTFISKLLRDISHLDVENSLLKKENQNFKSLKIEMPYDIKIQQLERENERLKEEIDKLGIKHENYCNTLYWDMKNQYDRYKVALEEIKKLINETCWDYTDISIIPVKEKMLEVINEVLK